MAIRGPPWYRSDGTVNWRARNEAAFRFFYHPATRRQAVRAGVYPSDRIAQRRTQALSQRKRGKRLRYAGGVHMNEDGIGRLASVFVHGWNPPHLLHEVLITEELILTGLPLWDAPILRGSDVDPDLRSDATIVGRRSIHLELDRGNERRRQLQKQIDAYRVLDPAEAFVVWVAPTRARIEMIRRLAEGLKAVTLFALAETGVWEDADGNRRDASEVCSLVL